MKLKIRGLFGRAERSSEGQVVASTITEAERFITIDEFITAIRRLRADPPEDRPGVWYRTQKEHWLGWLAQYDGPGAYNRKGGPGRGAKFAYNHFLCTEGLLWLVKAAGVNPALVEEARAAAETQTSLSAKAGAIRRVVPWKMLYAALFECQGAATQGRLRG